MNSYKCTVSGKVQGVYYRKNVAQNASKENFKGYVKNLPNGDVEACIECKKDTLERFIAILKQGSPTSRVDNIDIMVIDANFENFEIRY